MMVRMIQFIFNILFGSIESCVEFILILIEHFFIGLLDYNILADIRSMSNGRKSLFHNNYKFYAQRIATKTRWLCTKHANKKRCNAIMSTTDIDGKTMMKIICAEHTHQAQE